jgi:alkylated DNA repair dioxygenase AlkB
MRTRTDEQDARPLTGDAGPHAGSQHTGNGGGADAAGNLLPCDGEAFLIADAIPPPEADRLFAALLHAIAWRAETALVMGRRIALPRLTAWYGDAAYTYSGIRNAPAAWIPELLAVKAIAERCAGAGFNSVLCNLYRDGRDSVSWHADDEPAMGDAPVIASISLGAVRRFQLRHKAERALTVALDLPHGSCLVMAGATQRRWLHQLPKTARPVGPRINLTFRYCGPGAKAGAPGGR